MYTRTKFELCSDVVYHSIEDEELYDKVSESRVELFTVKELLTVKWIFLSQSIRDLIINLIYNYVMVALKPTCYISFNSVLNGLSNGNKKIKKILPGPGFVPSRGHFAPYFVLLYCKVIQVHFTSKVKCTQWPQCKFIDIETFSDPWSITPTLRVSFYHLDNISDKLWWSHWSQSRAPIFFQKMKTLLSSL